MQFLRPVYECRTGSFLICLLLFTIIQLLQLHVNTNNSHMGKGAVMEMRHFTL